MTWGWLPALLFRKSKPLTLMRRGTWMLLEKGGGLNQPASSRSPRITLKNKIFLIFWKFIRKVTKYQTSNTTFSWRNGHLKKVWSTPHPIRFNTPYPQLLDLNLYFCMYMSSQHYWFVFCVFIFNEFDILLKLKCLHWKCWKWSHWNPI